MIFTSDLEIQFAYLASKQKAPKNYPLIAVRKYGGRWNAFTEQSLLFLYQKLQNAGIIKTIPVTRFRHAQHKRVETFQTLMVSNKSNIDETLDGILKDTMAPIRKRERIQHELVNSTELMCENQTQDILPCILCARPLP